MNCIEKGTKLSVRFPINGLCSIEDLFDIELIALDNYALSLDVDLSKKSKSFITKKNVKDKMAKLCFDIIIRVIDIIIRVFEIRMADIDRAEKSQESKALREKAARILANRKDSAMEELSDKELEKIVKG